MVLHWDERKRNVQQAPSGVYNRSWLSIILNSCGWFKRKLVKSKKRRLLFVFILTVSALTILFMQCPHSSETCIGAFLSLKQQHLTKRSNQVNCPWDYFIKNYPLSDLKNFGSAKSKGLVDALRILRNTSTQGNKQKTLPAAGTTVGRPLLPSKNGNRTGSRGEANGRKKSAPLIHEKMLENVKKSSIFYTEKWKPTNLSRSANLSINSVLDHTKANSFRQRRNDLRPRIKRKNLMMVKKHDCQPLYPQTVFYNRIFKTASTTMSLFFKNSSKALNYDFKRDQTEQWSNEKKSHAILTRFENAARRDKRKNRRLFAVAHFYFRKELRIKANYTYINLLREPVERFISHYYYARSPLRWPEKLMELKRLGQLNESIEECLEKQHDGCKWNVMTRFFCGPLPSCKNGSAKALQQAKYNLEHYYASVGVLEHLEEFVKVLHKRLPGFVIDFSGVLDRAFVTKGVSKKPFSDTIMAKIVNVNRADIELYNFAKLLFLKQAKKCGVKVGK